MSARPSSDQADTGSTLPLLLAGLLFLAIFSLSLLGAAEFLQQQRQVNGFTDAIALDLTQLISDGGLPDHPSGSELQAQAAHDLADFYGIENSGRIEATLEGAESVQVSYCESSRVAIALEIWGGQAQVCAVSRAQAR